MSGYTIKQLLEWTLDDRLIDSYSVDEDGLYCILSNGSEVRLTVEAARNHLLTLLRNGEDPPPRIEA